MAAARAGGSRRGTSRPLSASSISSGVPPTAVATTARPAVIASSTTRLNASGITEGTATTSAAA